METRLRHRGGVSPRNKYITFAAALVCAFGLYFVYRWIETDTTVALPDVYHEVDLSVSGMH